MCWRLRIFYTYVYDYTYMYIYYTYMYIYVITHTCQKTICSSLDGLVNNAAVIECADTRTAGGLEMTFATNVSYIYVYICMCVCVCVYTYINIYIYIYINICIYIHKHIYIHTQHTSTHTTHIRAWAQHCVDSHREANKTRATDDNTHT